jgi:simple sugar transport system ATP-binding protein
LLRALAGRARASRGRTESPDIVAFIPEDRHHDALVLDFDLTENVVLKGAGARRGTIAWHAERKRGQVLAEQFDVRGGNTGSPVRTLSGGNQQKVVLARELEGSPRLVVAENPTRGLDIRAAREVRLRLQRVASGGASVVIYSSDLDEVLSIATRVLVMHGGALREVGRDRDAIGRAMLGVA